MLLHPKPRDFDLYSVLLHTAAGCCFLFGGMFYKVQAFNVQSVNASGSLLLLACIGIAIPTAASQMITDPDVQDDWILLISRGTAVVLMIW